MQWNELAVCITDGAFFNRMGWSPSRGAVFRTVTCKRHIYIGQKQVFQNMPKNANHVGVKVYTGYAAYKEALSLFVGASNPFRTDSFDGAIAGQNF